MSNPRSPDADKRSVERKEAERIYLEAKGDIKLVDIAKKLGLPDNKVRKWKSLDDWEGKLHPQQYSKGKKKQVERSTSKKRERSSTDKGSVPPKNKGGAPKGNQNAKGGKGNPFPVKPLKHGGYSKQYWAGLDEEEQRILDEIDEDPILLLTESIKLLTVREYRIRRAIDMYKEKESKKENLYISTTMLQKTQRKFKDDEEKEEYERAIRKKIEKGERLPGESETLLTTTQSTMDLRIRLQKELTSVTNQKTKAIEALAKLQQEKEGSAGDNDAIKIWAEKVRIMRSKGGGKDD